MDLERSNHAIHISALNQIKWWFAKRFLHLNIVEEYSYITYIFLWDEDLGVENFHPGRYLSIVKDEGLEISQPALDSDKSEVHHQLTARGRRSRVQRWVEMMAPLFSKASWRCTWYMIQNDLIHAWGVDMQLGYCAQGDQTKNVGVVDAEYIIHQGLPTLGAIDDNKSNSETRDTLLTHLTDSFIVWICRHLVDQIMCDTLVLTMRIFQSKALDDKRKGKA